LTTALEELRLRVATIADKAASEHDDDTASELFARWSGRSPAPGDASVGSPRPRAVGAERADGALSGAVARAGQAADPAGAPRNQVAGTGS
jgi:hypothetical protein